MKQTTLDRLTASLKQYETDLANVEATLSMKAKTLAEALQEQATSSYFFDSRKAELKQLTRMLETERDKVRGTRFKHYTETYSRQLSERAINNYIDFDDEYLAVSELVNHTLELYDKYAAVVEAFSRRGFALRDYTTALVNSLHEVVI